MLFTHTTNVFKIFRLNRIIFEGYSNFRPVHDRHYHIQDFASSLPVCHVKPFVLLPLIIITRDPPTRKRITKIIQFNGFRYTIFSSLIRGLLIGRINQESNNLYTQFFFFAFLNFYKKISNELVLSHFWTVLLLSLFVRLFKIINTLLTFDYREINFSKSHLYFRFTCKYFYLSLSIKFAIIKKLAIRFTIPFEDET